MTREEQDKLWKDLSEEQRAGYRKEFQQETKKYDTDVKYCDRENDFEYYTGYSHGVATTLEELFGSHNLSPSLTYEDVERKVFPEHRLGIIDITLPVFSGRHAEKLDAQNKLIVVAKYLNKNEDGSDWTPDWSNGDEPKYSFCYDGADNCLKIQDEYNWCHSFVYFRTKELAEQAIQILGEETIKLALSTDY